MKILFTALMAVAMILTCCACAPASVPEAVPIWTVDEGITLRLAQEEYPVGVEALTIIMENRTDRMMLYGNGWSFEKWSKGGWTPVENSQDAAFTSEGYYLCSHSRETFTAMTYALCEPLEEGLYRMTGCTLRVSDSMEAMDAGEWREYPPYQLEFVVSKDAQAEPEQHSAAEPGEWEMNEKEDWEWYTAGDCAVMLERSGCMAVQFEEDGHGLLAVLWRKNGGSEMIRPDELLTLYLIDLQTGELFAVFDEPCVLQGDISAKAGGGFLIDAAGGSFVSGRENGQWYTRSGS